MKHTETPQTNTTQTAAKPAFRVPNVWLVAIFIVAAFAIVFFTSFFLMDNLPEADPITTFPEAVERWSDRTVKVKAGGSVGTAFIVETEEQEDGTYTAYLLTNHHVVSADTSSITVTLDGKESHATLVGYQSQKDLAVLVCTVSKRYKKMHETSAVLGEQIMALGYGEGSLCVREGVVSRTATVDPSNRGVFCEVTSPLIEGMSGGPVFDVRGRLVGIASYHTESAGEYLLNQNYIIPTEIAMQEYEYLKRDDFVYRVSYTVRGNNGAVVFDFGSSVLTCDPYPVYLGERVVKVGKTSVSDAVDFAVAMSDINNYRWADGSQCRITFTLANGKTAEFLPKA